MMPLGPPRYNEINGIDYNFIDETEFMLRLIQGLYVTYNSIHQRKYGVLQSEIDPNKISVGHSSRADIHTLRQNQGLSIKCIGLIPPSYQDWLSRVNDRVESGLITPDGLSNRK